MSMSIVRIVVLLTAALGVAPFALAEQKSAPAQNPAPKPVANEPESTTSTATFGDWQLRCTKTEARKNCELVQSVIIKGQSAPFAQIAIGRPKDAEPMHITVVVPINVSFPSAVHVSEDEKGAQSMELAYTRCLPTGCFASATLKDDVIKRWRGLSQPGQTKFASGSGQDIQMPVSFRGLAQALDALAKEK